MADFYNIFGEQPSYIPSLLGEDEADRLRRSAQQSGLMNLGLSLLAGAGPQPQRTGIGQLLAQGVMAGQQASRNAYEQAVRDRMMQEQLVERQQQKQEQQLAQGLLPQILRPGQELYGEDIMGQKVGVGVGAPQLDLGTLQKLLTMAPTVASKVLPTIEAYRKLAAPETPKLEKLSAEERLINPITGQVVATGAPKEKPIHYQDLGDVVVGLQDGKEVFRQRKGRPPEGPVSKQLVETASGYVVFDPKTTTVAPVTLGGQPLMGKEGKPNEAQLNAAGFAQRMAASEQIVNTPEIAKAAPATISTIVSGIPVIGKASANIVQSPEEQQYTQASRDWIRAKLRKESGAAIGVDEEANEFRTYFPMPGDSEKVIKQKTEARQRAIQSMMTSAGPALKETVMKKPETLKTPQELAIEELKRRRGQ